MKERIIEFIKNTKLYCSFVKEVQNYVEMYNAKSFKV